MGNREKKVNQTWGGEEGEMCARVCVCGSFFLFLHIFFSDFILIFFFIVFLFILQVTLFYKKYSFLAVPHANTPLGRLCTFSSVGPFAGCPLLFFPVQHLL